MELDDLFLRMRGSESKMTLEEAGLAHGFSTGSTCRDRRGKVTNLVECIVHSAFTITAFDQGEGVLCLVDFHFALETDE
jgi:hypothetical protein